MALVQIDLHERGVLGGVAGVDRGKPGRHADVRQDDVQVFGATISRMSASTLRTCSSVTSNRVPDCAFRLIMNWLASVRGKNATLSCPYNGKLAPKTTASGDQERGRAGQRESTARS